MSDILVEQIPDFTLRNAGQTGQYCKRGHASMRHALSCCTWYSSKAKKKFRQPPLFLRVRQSWPAASTEKCQIHKGNLGIGMQCCFWSRLRRSFFDSIQGNIARSGKNC